MEGRLGERRVMGGILCNKIAKKLFIWMMINVDGFIEFVWFYMETLKRNMILRREGLEETIEDTK